MRGCGSRFLSFPKRPHQLWAHPVSCSVVPEAPPAIKRPQREAAHSPPTYTAEVKNEWSSISTPSCAVIV